MLLFSRYLEKLKRLKIYNAKKYFWKSRGICSRGKTSLVKQASCYQKGEKVLWDWAQAGLLYSCIETKSA